MERHQLRARVAGAVSQGASYLLDRQRPDGGWTDRLSSSAMPTAIAALALAEAGSDDHGQRVAASVGWLREQQREDGGWGLADADPPSDGSVTAFALAALAALDPEGSRRCIERATAFIEKLGGRSAILPNVRTWRELVSIIWAMTGMTPPQQQPVQPMEIMLLPAGFRNRASIALPGVIGLGAWQSRVMSLSWPARIARKIAEPRGLQWLRSVQGSNGGMEECPLMAALVYLGLHKSGPDTGADIQRGCLSYLLATQRPDGSWAIDRDLEVAVTAYSVLAMAEQECVTDDGRLGATREWLLGQQWREPFRPLRLPAGGWSWANPTGWPESEDTAVVLSALRQLGVPAGDPAMIAGRDWLLSRQNSDGSWSEWVRNSSMVHDGPCAGVTAHVVMAFRDLGVTRDSQPAIGRAFRYFARAQDADGGIPSLWFRDRTHGTAKLLEAYAHFGQAGEETAQRARRWLIATQREDGGWPLTAADGSPADATAEETAWALYSLLAAGEPAWDDHITAAVDWLAAHQDMAGTWRPSAVGLYYDQMYYSDDLIAHTYPLRALGRWLGAAALT
ncbi:MAG: hypothetical protein J2P32_00320 [Actinobacteria bacterium]|nr:hypothetical protein [Actinomycetota bacterium]